MNRQELAEYQRRLEAREARQREIDEARGFRTAGATTSINPPRKRKNRRKKRRNRVVTDYWSSRNEYGNTVIQPWRRNNSGGWSRS